MTVIAEYGLPAEDFVLGRATVPGLGVDLERWILDGDVAFIYCWVSGARYDAFEDGLDRQDVVEGYDLRDDVARRRFYRVRCDRSGESLVNSLSRFEAALCSGEGDDERWSLLVRFEDTDVLSDFQEHCVDEAGVALELDCLYNASGTSSQVGPDLTARQRETLITAYEKGYFDIPRKMTLVDIADELDISDQAVSERLRRGESELIRTHLLGDT